LIRSLMFVSVVTLGLATPAVAQQKQSILINKTSADTRYTQEHIIDVGDVPGHQVRVYEISWTYKKGELAFDGVEVKEAWTRACRTTPTEADRR
jgi:hypothetical protein